MLSDRLYKLADSRRHVGILGAVVLPPRHVLLKFLVREVGLEPTTVRLYTGCSFTELLPQIWWVLLESNQVCPKASDLQSGAVASAAQNPEFGAGDGTRTHLRACALPAWKAGARLWTTPACVGPRSFTPYS